MSTSLEGLGKVVSSPPRTYSLLQKLNPRVLSVALGMLAIVVMESPIGSYLKELVVGVSVPAEILAPPPVKIRLPMVAAGM